MRRAGEVHRPGYRKAPGPACDVTSKVEGRTIPPVGGKDEVLGGYPCPAPIGDGSKKAEAPSRTPEPALGSSKALEKKKRRKGPQPLQRE